MAVPAIGKEKVFVKDFFLIGDWDDIVKIFQSIVHKDNE